MSFDDYLNPYGPGVCLSNTRRDLFDYPLVGIAEYSGTGILMVTALSLGGIEVAKTV